MALQDDINNFNSSNTAADLLSLAAQTASCTTNRINKVATTNMLPDLSCSTIGVGTIFFVEDIGVPVVAQAGCWTGLDNRELRSDACVNGAWGWGGQATGTSIFAGSVPSLIVGGFTDWSNVSTKSTFSAGIRKNGTAWVWGSGSNGLLGDGSTGTVCRSSPVSLLGGFTDWCQVSVGLIHGIGLRSNGTVWSWGCGNDSQLGHGTITDRTSPGLVCGGATTWCQISAGTNHNLAVRTNGTLWAWGSGLSGKLGNNGTTASNVPVSVVGGFTDWCQASAGGNHSLAVRQNGTLWAWGTSARGQLGDGTAVSKLSPVSVVGGFTDWCQASAGCEHSLGIRTNGTLWAWGTNGSGQLGDGTTISRSSPVSVIGGFTDWCRASAGECHTAAIRQNGTLWGWGLNTYGRLANLPVQSCSPGSITVSGSGSWCAVSAGTRQTLAVDVR